jgi:hypothetical protein
MTQEQHRYFKEFPTMFPVDAAALECQRSSGTVH